MKKWGFKLKQVEVDGVKINYAEAGVGKIIVMIHGFSNNWEMWVPVAKILKKKYKVIMPDLPGFGDSDRLKKYNLKIEAEYLKKFIGKLKFKSPILMGHSMGAEVAIEFGENYPTRIGGLMLVSSIFAKERPKRLVEVAKDIYVLIEKSLFWTGVLEKVFLNKNYSWLIAKFFNMHEMKMEMIEKYGIIGKKKMSIKAYLQLGRSMMKKSGLPKIRKDLPVLFICGQNDRIANCETTRKMTERKENYESCDVSDSGHMVIWEKPKEVGKVVEKFVG
jgi:pimeloyl-ACP methyl ester carboxylesterase